MNELATKENSIRATLEKMAPQFAMALPKILKAERFIRVALTCINRNPKLLQCTRDSLLACLLDCAQLGIEPDGRRAHLIPYGDKCTLIIDYKGLAELVRRSGEVSTLHAGIVYPSDDFDYAFGTGQFLKHRPALSREEGEKPICVYSYVRLKDGQEDFDVMGIPEVEKIRKRSRAGGNGPWVTDFDEMAKKTAFRRHSKWLPLSPELREKIEKDDEPLTEQERFAAAKPVVSEGIQFGDAGLPPEVTAGTESRYREENGEMVQNEPPKRKRRTKAEMEAAREIGDANAAPESFGNAPKPEAPPRATPLEGLRNLIDASPVDEQRLRLHLIKTMVLEPHQKFEDLTDDKILQINSEFMTTCSEILDGDKEKAPY